MTENYEHIEKDIRDIDYDDVEGVDAIIHMAALSNDPLGELSPGLTEDINLYGTIRLAEIAKKVGVGKFIYVSSQSMYGVSDANIELDEDNSAKNPITSYAKTKWDAECKLFRLNSENFSIVAFRPSTVFGVSPRLRSDIVFNNLVGCGYTTNKIEIRSDGSPIRPVVHIKDVSNALIAGITAPSELVSGRSFNIGIPNGNFTVKQLAEAAQRVTSGCELFFTGEHGLDSRTYKVSFARILQDLKEFYKPEWDLYKGGTELINFYKKINFSEQDYRGEKTNRLKKLNSLQEKGLINSNMRWQEN